LSSTVFLTKQEEEVNQTTPDDDVIQSGVDQPDADEVAADGVDIEAKKETDEEEQELGKINDCVHQLFPLFLMFQAALTVV